MWNVCLHVCGGWGRRWQHGLPLNAVPSVPLYPVRPSSYQAPLPIRSLNPAIFDRVSGAHNTGSLHSLLYRAGKPKLKALNVEGGI